MKYTESIGAEAPEGFLRYGILDNIVMARSQEDEEVIFYNAFKRDAMTLRKMYQNTCRLLNIRMVLDSTWSDDAVDTLKMLVVDLGPYLTVRGKVQRGEVKTALSSSVLRSLTGHTWDTTVPVRDDEEGKVLFRDRRVGAELPYQSREEIMMIWKGKDPAELGRLPNPILFEDIPEELRQIVLQTCEDLRCLKEEYMQVVHLVEVTPGWVSEVLQLLCRHILLLSVCLVIFRLSRLLGAFL